MADALKNLRHRLIFITTGIAFFLIAIVAGAYCLSVYNSATNEISIALERALSESSQPPPGERPPLDVLDENNGQVPFNNIPSPLDQDERGQAPQNQDSSSEGIDFFQGRRPLVFLVAINENQQIAKEYSPAILLDSEVLANAIEKVFSAPDFSQEEGITVSGKLQEENLYYKAKTSGETTYLALTDAAQVDEQIHGAIFGSLALATIVLTLTLLVSIFLTRMSLKPVEEAWKKQHRFIADASHELKTPLTVIMANTEIVKSEPRSMISEHMKWLDSSVEEGKRLQGLIADLLLLASLDDTQSSRDMPGYEDVNFSELVENAIMSFEAIAYEHDLVLENSIEPDLFIRAAGPRIARLPHLLIDNACKYTEKGGKVSVLLRSQENKGILRITNTCSNIPEDQIGSLFDRFYRTDKARSNKTPGYGLGLSIAQSIVQEVQGTISAENLSENEVAFMVTFPLAC